MCARTHLFVLRLDNGADAHCRLRGEYERAHHANAEDAKDLGQLVAWQGGRANNFVVRCSKVLRKSETGRLK